MTLETYFTSLDQIQKVLFWIALPTTIILVLQTFSIFLGVFDFDINTDHSSIGEHGNENEGYQIWSFKNLVVFLSLFSLTALTTYHKLSPFLCGFLSIFVASLFVAFNVLIMKLMTKLQADATIKLDSYIGQTAVVYLGIPENGIGQIEISTAAAILHQRAKTLDGSPIGRYDIVKINNIENSIYIVEKLK